MSPDTSEPELTISDQSESLLEEAMPAKDVFKDNTYQYEFQVLGPATSTGARGPKAGLTDLVAFFSETKDGAPIHADLQVTVAERSGKPGTYFATIPKAAVNARLFGSGAANFAGKSIYVIAMNADADSWSKIKVRADRPSG